MDSPDPHLEQANAIGVNIAFIHREMTKVKLAVMLEPKSRAKHIPRMKELLLRLDFEQRTLDKLMEDNVSDDRGF